MNIASYLPRRAVENPYGKALILPLRWDGKAYSGYRHLTFKALDLYSDELAAGLLKKEISRGTRVLLMVRPGLNFVALSFALFKIGAVPVLIDPGMGKQNLLDCIKVASPQALIGIPRAHLARCLFPAKFSSVKTSIVADGWFPGIPNLNSLHSDSQGFSCVDSSPEETAAIVFTTGSTGTPKGVVYYHSQMAGQVESIRKEYSIEPSDVDFPVFPLFALFSTAWGIPAVLPDLDPTNPAGCDPHRLAVQIEEQGVTMSIGSPAVWDRLGAFCRDQSIKLPSMRRILMVGAPVAPRILESFEDVLENGDTFTPYGATEALPIASISGSEILSSTRSESESGRGTCVGRQFPGSKIRTISISEDPISKWDSSLELPPGEIGEICVKGPMVTREYLENPDATKLAKITEGEEVWHRMGDVGYLDEEGKLWFCGRKNHRVQTTDTTYYSVCVEAIFNDHPRVKRSALVGVESASGIRPVIIVEPWKNQMPSDSLDREKFLKELLELGSKFDHTAEIKEALFHPSFPVDIRHNAKIFREKLRGFAQRALESRPA
jgi:olefin beta-lactone synthetase